MPPFSRASSTRRFRPSQSRSSRPSRGSTIAAKADKLPARSVSKGIFTSPQRQQENPCWRCGLVCFVLSKSPQSARPYGIRGDGELINKDWNAEKGMIPIDLSGKVALVTGVGDNDSFAWFIAKALQAAGARLVFAVHPRMIRIVEGFLTGDAPDDIRSRALPYGTGNLTVEKVLPCDVSYDTMADVPEATR